MFPPQTAQTECADLTGLAGLAILRRTLFERLRAAEAHCSGDDCSACAEERSCACDHLGVEQLGEVVFLAFERFTAEEKCMNVLQADPVGRPHVLAHKEDHSEIAARLSALVHSWDARHPCRGLRELAAQLRIWLDEHVAAYDLPLQDLLTKQASQTPGQR